MGHIIGEGRGQSALFPLCMEDLIPSWSMRLLIVLLLVLGFFVPACVLAWVRKDAATSKRGCACNPAISAPL